MNDDIQKLIDSYVSLGEKWLAGQLRITTFGSLKLNPKQIEYINDKSPELLISGGYRSGKTVAMIVKMYLLAMMFPNNQILLGRKTISDIELTLIPAIESIFPTGTYELKRGYKTIQFPNGSQIHYMGLDTQVGGDDTKKATQKIRGLDLGAVFIDQLEEVEQVIWDQLAGRMSNTKVPFRQKCATTNPARFWAYDYFKGNPRKGTKLIETGMADNKDNLPEGFIEEQLEKGDMYVKRFVYGVWDDSTMIDGLVFTDARKDQGLLTKEPIRIVSEIKVFHEPENHTYQIGVDPSTGAEDPCAVVCVDTITGEVTATYSGFVPTNVITLKTLVMAELYSKFKKPLIIPEATGVGQAFVEDLKKHWDNIYEREVFSKRESKTIDKLGFYTNYASKIQLIDNMSKLFQARWPKLRDKDIVSELNYFAWTDEAKKQGAGAPPPYHDDRIMATLLAYWGLKPLTYKKRNILENRQKTETKLVYQYD